MLTVYCETEDCKHYDGNCKLDYTTIRNGECSGYEQSEDAQASEPIDKGSEGSDSRRCKNCRHFKDGMCITGKREPVIVCSDDLCVWSDDAFEPKEGSDARRCSNCKFGIKKKDEPPCCFCEEDRDIPPTEWKAKESEPKKRREII